MIKRGVCVLDLSDCHFIGHDIDNNNNNNNNHDDIYSAVIYGASHMREFTLVPLGESRSAPGGRQLVSQAGNLTYESACRPNIHLSPCIITQP